MLADISPVKGTGDINSLGGTFAQLPPPPPSSSIHATHAANNSVHDVNAKIESRKAKREERKLELLMEARNARIRWIRDGERSSTTSGTDGGGSSILDTVQMNQLQACRPDILPCAPQLIESLLSSNCDWRRSHERKNNSDLLNRMIMQLLEEQGLSWENVSKDSALTNANGARGVHNSRESSTSVKNPSLDLPPIPHPELYNAFLDALCNPSAADIVMSIQKFCSTIHEAANVMVLSMKGDNSGGDVVKPTEISLLNGESSNAATSASTPSAATPTQDLQNYGASLAKAVRGFINKTMRDIGEHEAFRNFVRSKEDNNLSSNGVSSMNCFENSTDGRDELMASLERFVYGKCRRDIDMVIFQSPEKVIDSADNKHTPAKTVWEIDNELHEKMLSLQFVSASHLEIQCLNSKTTGAHDDIDLSYTIEQLQSIPCQSSPRQMLHSILLAHRGVSYALNEACGHSDPPGADDVLPTLILATLRAHALNLPSALRFIETFAPLPLLRGEAGYAYTNLCGAIQFIKDLDVVGHLAEVAVLGGSGENSAVLSIGPEEFRIGLEMCRGKMAIKVTEEKRLLINDSVDGVVASNEVDFYKECTNDEKSSHVNITARHVRNAREHGEIVDLDWALEEQQILMWQQGRVADIPSKREDNSTETAAIARHEHLKNSLPPDEPTLPSQFHRSYSFLTAHHDNICIRDLPQLLKEYKMLVQVTEVLYNERSIWRESERKRLLKLERERLERGLADVMGEDDDNTNGSALID
ncbi:hypothetical protein ACHAXH_002759 [Discostella pseudostelligera]